MNKNDLVNEWVDYSRKDLESAKFLTGMKPEPFEIICFHCQQAVEKALKALLINKNVRPPRTHDLDELITLCDIIDIENLRNTLLPLNDYSVIVRYPSLDNVEKQDVIQALEATEQCLDVVNRILAI